MQIRIGRGVGAVLVAVLALWISSVVVHAQDNDIREPGVLVVSVVSGSPAAAAGLARGDIILAANGEQVDSADALIELISNAAPADKLVLRVLHGDEERELTAELGERDGRAYLGILPYMALASTDMMMSELHHPTDVVTDVVPSSEAGIDGALIVAVEEGSPAAEAGLKPGDVIVGIDGEDLTASDTLADRVAAHSPGDEVELNVHRDGSTDAPEQVTVTLGSHPDDEMRAFLGVGYRTAAMGMYENSAGAEELEQPEHPYRPYGRYHIRPFGTPRHFMLPPRHGGGFFRMPHDHGFWDKPGNGLDPEALQKWCPHHWESE